MRPVRPFVAVMKYTWTPNGAGVQVAAPGAVYLMTNLPRGSSEDQRHTGETLAYKLGIDLEVQVVSAQFAYANKSTHVMWLVYDAQPSGRLPATSDIFDYVEGFQYIPHVWKVRRDLCHRYIVKRKWMINLETNGASFGVDFSSRPVTAPKYRASFHKFVKRLGVRTEWKNSDTGEIGDIQRGALYLVVAPGNNVPINIRGYFRLYFKSVGNQ
ncbi:capsid protein [Sporobolus striate mosaic virus 1]|uniref:Capsid protein n=1 Tax=Sporobolus striate mosaic virus 1 TaxID=1302849 RepID=J7FGY6_9GEMI|nr:capsid protein [Sporobolus striate mosaic virus 1]AFN80714.1 capsid protein [Sporobolus striate mosaic virus 1]